MKHIAFIMDGNGRWATRKGLSRLDGHTKGIEVAKTIIKECVNKNIPYATFYALSVQNLFRNKKELTHLYDLTKSLIETFEKENDKKTKIKVIGITKYLPEDIQKIIKDIEEKTSSHNGTQISLCISYGGREEILETLQTCKTPISELTTASFSELLPLPDVDFVIRTSGEYRVSNFLMWQSAYAEYYFTETCWPDFSVEELDKAIEQYSVRNRRYGLEDTKKVEIVDTADIIEAYKEMYESYNGSIVFLYQELIDKGYKWEEKYEIHNQSENRDKLFNMPYMCSDDAVQFSIKFDDFLDHLHMDEQIVILKKLTKEYSIENIRKICPELIKDFILMTPEERALSLNVHKCELIQRTSDTLKPYARAAAIYYWGLMVSKDMFTTDSLLISSSILSLCDDIIDEDNDHPVLKYIDDSYYSIGCGAIQDFWEKHEHSQYRESATFLACSIFMNRFIRKVPCPKNMNQCFNFIQEKTQIRF